MLAIITCHFNFAGYNRPRQNLHRFVLQMQSFGHPLYGVEAFLPEHSSLTQGWDNWKQIMIDSDQIMFQKEALLNVAEKHVPPIYDKIAWVDADIWFENMDWFKMTEKLLDTFKVAQLFEHCHFSSQAGISFRSLPSFVSHFQSKKRSHPGFAWAAQRELWSQCGGLYPSAILGGGDNVAARAFVRMPAWKQCLGANPSVYLQWRQKVAKWVNAKYSFVPGDVFHEWHGSIANRAYSRRFGMIKNFDLTRITTIADNKLPKWTVEAPGALKADVYKYFINRKEDG